MPDNNFAENSIRPFVVGRENGLFSGTTEYSLIETVKAGGLEPYGYFGHIFENPPLARTLEDYEALLPWNCPRPLSPAACKGGVN